MLNESLQIISMVLCIVGVLQVIVGLKRWRSSVFFHIVFYIALFNYAIAILLGLRLEGHPGELVHYVLVASSFFEFVSGYTLSFFVIKWLIHCLDPLREVRQLRVANILAVSLYVLQVLTVVFAQFTDFCYSIGDDNISVMGDGFFLLIEMWAPSLILAVYLLAHFGKRLPLRYVFSFSIFAAISATAVIAQFFLLDTYYITIASSVCALVLYLLTVGDSAEMYLQKERESDRLKIEMMLSQIQPHFIFNSLSVIKHFCRNDPELAEKAIVDFSHFLRGNMDTLNSREPIRFCRELEHTKAYLSLEKYRFGEDLDINYDIETKAFLLPPLTLQPIVENAVRHGIRETRDGKGTVTIATREYDDRIEVVVTDDGKGFDTQKDPDTGKPHIGIENVRYRLRDMCGGTLTIKSEIGQGTVAVISVPKGELDADLRDR